MPQAAAQPASSAWCLPPAACYLRLDCTSPARLARLARRRLQVMEEGEALSRKQLAQEQTIKKLRGQAKELQGQARELQAALDAERAKAASAVSERASTAGELYSIREQHAAELQAERQHYERLLEVRRPAAPVRLALPRPASPRPARPHPHRRHRQRRLLAAAWRRRPLPGCLQPKWRPLCVAC